MKPQSLTLAAVLVTATWAVAVARGQGVGILEQAAGYGAAADGGMAGPGMGGGGDGYAPSPPGPRPFGVDCRHYVRVETLLLDRDVHEGLRLASRGLGGDIVLESSELEFDVEFATRFLVGIRLTDCSLLEASYFGFQNWEDRSTAADQNGLLFSIFSDFGADPAGGFGDTDSSLVHEIHYTSELHNAELNFINLRCGQSGCGNTWWCLGGIRYVEIQEGFDYLTIGNGGSSYTNVRTENDMVAFQMGLRYERDICCKLRVTGEVKTGVAVNMADLETDTTATIAGRLLERDGADEVAFLGEASVTGTYDVCHWLCIRGGYHVFYVDGVALATDNFDRTPPDSGVRVPVIDLDGSVLYHGSTIGVELHW